MISNPVLSEKPLIEPCTLLKSGAQGDCLLLKDCPVVLNAYTADKVKNRPQVCNAALRTVCCPVTIKSTTAPPIAASNRISAKQCQIYSKTVFRNETITDVSGNKVVKTINQCSQTAIELIIGGELAKEREFPHMALIGFGNGNPDEYKCGGSLISELWIISAAHCSYHREFGAAKWAKLGNVQRNQLNANTYTYEIIERIKHPSYTAKFVENDIMLFKLNKPVIFNTYVIPICLPQFNEFYTTKAIATGWGVQGFAKETSDSLQKVVLDYLPTKTCEESYLGDDKLNGANFENMICAGSLTEMKDTCEGDSGSPLQYYTPGIFCMYTIAGITSYGPLLCGASAQGAIYTRVYKYIDWIEGIVWPMVV
ncbi:unnamed protein product [Diamesa hyperborea]